jgi:putative alpha-1,2-mannosidase
LFNKVSIQLNPDYYKGKKFIINTKNNSANNIYINELKFNNRPVQDFNISHQEITNGGELILEMSNTAKH